MDMSNCNPILLDRILYGGRFMGNVTAEVKAILGDITKQNDVDAIVNAANRSLLGGGGVDGAIHRAAGPELLRECRTLNGCMTGEAKLTGAYKLPCKYIVHTVGPIWNGGKYSEEELLRKCYINSLLVAKDKGIRRIAFPSISTGVYSFPLDKAAKIAVQAVFDFVNEHPGTYDMIEWVCFDEKTLDVYSKQISEHVFKGGLSQNSDIKMSVSSMTGTKDKKAVYVLFQDHDRTAEFSIPGCNLIRNNGFNDGEVKLLKKYLENEQDTVISMAKEVNPIKALMG